MRETSSDWTPFGETFNTRYYLAAPDIAIVMPQPGLKDDEASARINIDFQTAWAKSSGDRCAVVVCLFNLLSQDSGARRVYADGMDPGVFYAAALVVSNPISRAIGSFFIGLTRPGVPTRIVGHHRGRHRLVCAAAAATEHLKVDTAAWMKFATTSNADFYEIEPHALVVVPFEGTTDDARTARESVAAQLEYLRARGQRAGIIVLMDRVSEQNGGARTIYRDEARPGVQACFAAGGQHCVRPRRGIHLHRHQPAARAHAAVRHNRGGADVGQGNRAGSLGDGAVLPAQLVEGLLQLCQADFSYRLPRTRLRDQDDTVAFFFNAIAEELERLVTASRDNEARMTTLVERLGEALVLVASGDFSVQVERDYRGDPADVLVFLVNNTITELAEYVSASGRRAEIDRRRLEELVHARTRELELLATTDELTGLLNRRRVLEIATEECLRAERYPEMLCIAMFDIDHFKPINDRFGHSAGDTALRLVGRYREGAAAPSGSDWPIRRRGIPDCVSADVAGGRRARDGPPAHGDRRAGFTHRWHRPAVDGERRRGRSGPRGSARRRAEARRRRDVRGEVLRA